MTRPVLCSARMQTLAAVIGAVNLSSATVVCILGLENQAHQGMSQPSDAHQQTWPDAEHETAPWMTT